MTSSEDIFELTVSTEDRDEFKRLDVYLARKLPQYSRSLLKKLFENEAITSLSEGIRLELKKMPPVGTIIELEVPPPLPTDLIAENIPLEILYEDEYLIIINKPAGMVVHPAPGHARGTLVNAILYHCPDLKGIGQEKRPGIVHRLDAGTSGVMVVAKEQKCHEGLVELFSKHTIERKYQAITWGKPKDLSGTILSTIGRHPQSRLKMAANVKNGKKAITHFKVLFSTQKLSHIELKLETGRTHQIRVHLSQLLHTPIFCDPLYSDYVHQKKQVGEKYQEIIANYPHQLLHAKILGFVHPITQKELHFESPPPPEFQAILKMMSEEK